MKSNYELLVYQYDAGTVFRFLFMGTTMLVPVSVYTQRVENSDIAQHVQQGLLSEAVKYANWVLYGYGEQIVSD